jgi:hypothetical protein
MFQVTTLILGGWFFITPWPSSQEYPIWALEEASEEGHCIEVCWYMDGRSMGCSPMTRTEDGMNVCKEKLARTQGFEMALDVFIELATTRSKSLREEIDAVRNRRPMSMISMRDRMRIEQLEARENEIQHLMHKLQERIENVPQEVKPNEEG